MTPHKQHLIARMLQSLPSLFMFLVFMVIWISNKLGFSQAAMKLMTRQMQSPRLKARAFSGYQPTARDVFVCTYAKSGTNWTMQIAYQIAQRGNGEFAHIHDVVPWPEAPLPGIVRLDDERTYRHTATGMRVIKTHLESSYVPYSPEAKYIIVVRDPKEVCVSSYFFMDGIIGQQVSVDRWHAMFLSDSFIHGSWVEHLAGYWPWRTRPNVLLLSYGEMKEDLEGSVRRIAQLMGTELSAAELAQVVEKSSFSYMKRIDHKFIPPRPWPLKWLRQPVMIRKGERGASSELLSVAQQEQIDRHMQAELRRYGCDFPYERVFGANAKEVASHR